MTNKNTYRIARFQNEYHIQVFDTDQWYPVTIFGYALIEPMPPFSRHDLILQPFDVLQDAKNKIDCWLSGDKTLRKPDEIIYYPNSTKFNNSIDFNVNFDEAQNGMVYVWDQETGKMVWRYPTEEQEKEAELRMRIHNEDKTFFTRDE